MQQNSTIQLERKTIEILKEAKHSPRETYNELIQKMVKVYLSIKKNNQYDRFIHAIQQRKMKELWDNKEDEYWENV